MDHRKFAKSKLANGKQPTVREHLLLVADFSGKYGREIGAEAESRLAGQFHDFGKYGDLFQLLLLQEIQKIDHALPGAAFLFCVSKERLSFDPIIEAISAHHSELVQSGLLKEKLKASLSSKEPVISMTGKQSALSGKNSYQAAWNCFQQDYPDFKLPKIHGFKPDEKMEDYYRNLQTMLFTRMLFSCLVDADYTVSASEENESYVEQSERTEFDAESLLNNLKQYVSNVRADSTANSELNQLRDELFEICGAAGEQNETGLFTLTAPTGTGKTLALLHFALRHCARWGKTRVILVLPFLTLTEQSAKTYRKILPDVLEDHSQSDLSDQERIFSARWRYPVIITTSVKFFESLFASKPTDCRKLHSIANSVILFDEAQSLPPDVTEASLIVVRELCRRYHCTMVFSTATQPDYGRLKRLGDRWQPKEILPEYKRFYSALKRTNAEWRLKCPTPLEEIAREMMNEQNVCAIVNLRRHAGILFQLLEEQCQPDELFLISTDLCPAHRSEVIEAIKDRQKHNLRSVVVSTQCIEAGVDLDFAVVYRALAPLDSIVQAAGRCNRNGKQRGRVVIFEPDEAGLLYPQDWNHWYQNAAETTKRLNCDKPLDLEDPEDIQRYYSDLFRGLKDKPKLERAVMNLDYHVTAVEYQLIKNDGIRVIVPFMGLKEVYDEIVQAIKVSGMTKALMKRCAPLTVSSFEGNNLEMFLEPIPYQHQRQRQSEDEHISDSGYYLLRENYTHCYNQKTGLQIPKDNEIQAIF